MQLFINEVLSGSVQLILFSLIPFIWWLVTARKQTGFLAWIGLKRVNPAKGFGVALLISFAFFLTIPLFMQVLDSSDLAGGEYAGLGIAALPAAMVYSFLTTALTEEILFRGFLLKRLAARFGFTAGNITQAAIFGLLHGFMVFSVLGSYGLGPIAAVSVLTGLIAWYLGYLNERKANGSILPSWGVHAASNLATSMLTAFAIW